jgi:sugar phosphate isomerase/epimerase
MATIGVQAMMLKNEFADSGPFETLRRVSGIGYNAVEISQIPMTAENVTELRRARDELGMDIAALSATLDPSGRGDSLEGELDKIVTDARALDCTMVRIGMLPIEALASLDAVLDFCDRSNAAAERLRDRGIRLYYHNHHIEFARYDGRFLLDILAESAPAMGLELDVHWVQRGGLDPVSTLEKYGERVAMVHLKDYRIGQLPPEAFQAMAAGDDSAFMAHFAGVVQFAEVGEGTLDFPAIIRKAQDIGAEYLLVEQDEQYGRSPLDCLRTSHDNLIGMGFADLF